MKLWIIAGILLVILFFRFFLFYHNQPQYADGQQLNFNTTLLSEPQITSRLQQITAKLASGEKIFIKIPQYPQFHYGDTVHISGSIKVLLLKPRSAGQAKKTILTMSFPKIEAVEKKLALISWFRQKVTSLFSSTLPATSSSLLLGIVFGIKENMPRDFTDNLRISGVMHVIAASGMNVTMIAGFLAAVFSFFLRRQIALGFGILGIIFYALLAGLEPSILRASIMGALVFSAQILGRQNLGLFGLSISCFLMLFFSPPTLFDIGFQLSFAATLGLLFLKRLPTTIAAQLATLPILLSNFGTYSIWSVLVNALVLWTIPILMGIGGISALIGILFAPLGSLILYFSLPFLVYFEKIVTFFGQTKGVVTIANFPWQFAAAYYLFLAALVVVLKNK